MAKKTKLLRIMTSVLAIMMIVSSFLAVHMSATGTSTGVLSSSGTSKYEGAFINNYQQYFDSSVMYKLPDTVSDNTELSLIISMKSNSLLDVYKAKDTSMSYEEFAKTEEAAAIRESIVKDSKLLREKLDAANIPYELGASYDTVLAGFEVVTKAENFKTISEMLSTAATVIVGEEYKTAETKLVENDVNFYENTGIFDSSDFAYNGSGTLVAVLDTGLDYYHSAFSDANFAEHNKGNYALTFAGLSGLVSDLRANNLQAGLTASDLYISNKVPYGFDYADNDSDVFPLLNEHGTHVAGVVAGHDDVITGVAPGAQLAIMKIFSDVMETSRTAWILNALEDCVTLGVDVINMSIGTSCGFSRITDEEAVSTVYDDIRELGINMVVAASNSFNSTYASDKNGNLPLTSNPDSATVGSPSTYPGALCVASIDGKKTPYILSGDRIIYFIESTDRVSEEKDFVGELLTSDTDSIEIEYVTIPGAGRSADYTGIDVKGKIALVRRGHTTFEEKAGVALAQGAAGVIIYNNVSGDIKMNVGEVDMPICSISQEDGEVLAEKSSGKIKISRKQTSGPFISDFSSWGPSPDLGIKPEITAHGGNILSAVPGQSYDRISGTSMATPNISGFSALMRQYVVEKFPELKDNSKAISTMVNRLMMSTADITLAKNGNPYAVRKQGAGLANLAKSGSTNAFIITYDRKTGEEMDKTKIELGDDPAKTGVYKLTFAVKNFGKSALSYNIGAYVLTENVSENKTNHGETTSTQDSRILDGAKIDVKSISGGTLDGKRLTVSAGAEAKVTVTITLSDKDKKYLDESFENGMYVEGFVTLDAVEKDSVDLNVPYLAFYGDWTEAPIFDLEYFETSKDELDDSIDLLDKTLPDAYASRPVGGTTYDYMSFLGSYYFIQAPGSTMIAADRNHIAISNHQDALNSLRFVWAGMLRNADHAEITIVEDATGEIVYQVTDNDIRKSYGDGGDIRPAQIEIEFSAIEQNLKNNTAYTVTVKSYLDYDRDGAETNDNNTITFPLVTDFQAPVISDCEFYTEYDRSSKKTRLFAKIPVYDNHYAMALQIGYIGNTDDGPMFYQFDRYPTQVYSDFNSTTYVTYELTDYIDDIATNSYEKNTFVVSAYDYAVNVATYEIPLPDDYTDFYFEEETVTLSPYEVYDLRPTVYPVTEWADFITYNSSNPKVAKIVDDQIVALAPGKSLIRATYQTPEGTLVATMELVVLGEDDRGYVPYDKPVANKFELTGYMTTRAFYQLDTNERDIGSTGDLMKFVNNNFSLSMYPSEAVQLLYSLEAYFPADTKVTFETANDKIVKVDSTGLITAVAEGRSSVTVRVLMDGRNTYYSQSVNIEVKDPYITSGPQLTHYFGNGGVVRFPKNIAVTSIGQFAFSNFDYVPKTEAELLIDDQSTMKAWFLGDTENFTYDIKEVYIPEGVERIGAYAFANMTKLEVVHLPKSLETIDYGAFYGCTSLKTVNGIENVKFINQQAFYGCALKGTINLDSVVAISTYAFAENKAITALKLPKTLQSVGAYAFMGNTAMTNVTIDSEIVKLGKYAFANCSKLKTISLNAAVIPTGTFEGCTSLETVTLGRDVAVIAEHAFLGTNVAKFNIAEGNTTYTPGEHEYVLNADGTEVLLVAPAFFGEFRLDNYRITKIADNAFSGNSKITSVYLPYVTELGSYAFSECTSLKTVTFGNLEIIKNHALHNTAITALPSLAYTAQIGDYAFARTSITNVVIPDNMIIGEGAFASCEKLVSISIGDGVEIGKYAFLMDSNIFPLKNPETLTTKTEYYDRADGIRIYYSVYVSPIKNLTIGKNADIGYGAFLGAAEVEKIVLGDGASIGDYAFYNCSMLSEMDLSGVTYIGEFAFSGTFYYEFTDENMSQVAWDPETKNYSDIYYTNKLTAIDLSSLEYLGNCAFLCSKDLVEIKFGEKLEIIPEGAFARCDKLASANLENVKTFGNECFAETSLVNIDLSSAEDVNDYAFCYIETLESVKFGMEGVKLGEGVFSYANALVTVDGSEKLGIIGDYAFACTAITEIDLSGATSIGNLAFMKLSENSEGNTIPPVEFTVKLGNKLEDIGDNPFAYCIVKPFSSTVTETINGKDYTSTTYTFDISENVKVIDGSVYKVVPAGLELITWAGDSVAKVADNTVRISAMAFAGLDITSVRLPYTVASIGHKAFFMCNKINFIVFSSYYAPILEEEYDQVYWTTYQNIPATGEFEFTDPSDPDGDTIIYNGLGIVPFFMWNVTDMSTNGYYGANFMNYIGHIDNKIAMVAPSNGKHYDSFIFNQYFSSNIPGATAANDTTLSAIDAISKIPDKVTLKDKDIVEAARTLYNKILTDDQRALVNIERLTQAEKRIENLEYLNNQNNRPPVTPEDPGTDDDENDGSIITDLSIAAVAVVLVVGAVCAVFFFVEKKKNSAPKEKTVNAPVAKASSEENQENETTEITSDLDAEVSSDDEVTKE